jgi:hypothetical protein
MLGLMEHSASKITMHVSPYTIPCELNKYRVLLAVFTTGTVGRESHSRAFLRISEHNASLFLRRVSRVSDNIRLSNVAFVCAADEHNIIAC